MKRTLFTLFLIAASIYQINAQNLIKSSGWFESAFVCWDTVPGAQSYNVYYSGEGISDKKIDNALIRSYGSSMRADVLGLKAGQYTLTVKPVINELEQSGVTTPSLTVLAHDRSGFAFANGVVPGGYKADGTPKDNAVILYVHEGNKNTIEYNVVTSSNGSTTKCVGIQQIIAGFKKKYEKRPFIIRFFGTIKTTNCTDGQCQGDMLLDFGGATTSYLTLEGVGDDAVFHSFGIRMKNTHNVEVRNLAVMLCASNEGDNVGLQQDNSHIWVHHCDMFYGMPGSDDDQAKGDGTMDCKRSDYVTFSYNHFFDNGKTHLLGNSESEMPGNVTFHHNWYDHSDSRHPRVRRHNAHVYNNYFDGVAKYGVGAAEASSIFVEKNVFGYCPNPMMISMQGTDIASGSGTFSKEDGGMIKAFDNLYQSNYTHKFVAYDASSNAVEFDAFVVTSRNDTIPVGVAAKKGGATYNNFDTKSTMYIYTPHATSEVVDNVKAYAGRVQGGDFKWTFTSADNTLTDQPTAALMTALKDYRSKLVYIQGENFSGGDDDGDDDGENPTYSGDTLIVMEKVDITAWANAAELSTIKQTRGGIVKIGQIGTEGSNNTYIQLGNDNPSLNLNATKNDALVITSKARAIHKVVVWFTTNSNGNVATPYVGFSSDTSENSYVGSKTAFNPDLGCDMSNSNSTNVYSAFTYECPEGTHAFIFARGRACGTTAESGRSFRIQRIEAYAKNDTTPIIPPTDPSTLTEDLSEEDLQLFPNPTSDVLNVKMQGLQGIEIIDLAGRIVIRKKDCSETERLNVSTLREGLYFVRIYTNDNKTIIRKFIRK